MGKVSINSFFVRALSGIVLFTIVLLSLLSVYSFVALILAFAVGSLVEFYKMAQISGCKPSVKYGIFAVVVTILLNALVAAELLPFELLSVVGVVAVIPFAIALYQKEGNPFMDLSTSLMGIVYVALPYSLMMWIAIGGLVDSQLSELISSVSKPTPQELYNPEVILACFFVIWANDIGAYLVGMTIGKRRLFERISPKKSWEGFFGGVIVATLVSVLAGYLMDYSLIKWGILGVIVAVSGVYGDLIESMFKRSVGVKDSGSVMPGHGGFLDRFDALLFAIPFVFVYFTIYALCM